MTARNALLLAFLPLAIASAVRLAERVDTFVIEPSRLQARLLGKVVAYPWQLRRLEIYGGGTGDIEYDWTYSRPGGFRELAGAGCRPKSAPPIPGQGAKGETGCAPSPAERGATNLFRSISMAGDEMHMVVASGPGGLR